MKSSVRVPRNIPTFPYCLEKVTDLSDDLRGLIGDAIDQEEIFEAIFVVPPEKYLSGWLTHHYLPEHALLFTPRGVIHVQGPLSKDQPGGVTYLSAENILFIKLTLCLLYARLEIVGQGKDAATQIFIEYNNVCHHLLETPLRKLIQKTWGTATYASGGSQDANQWSHVDQLPIKFWNRLKRYALQQEESLLGFVFQPEVFKRQLGLFRRKIIPNTLLVVTDKQIFLIQEELGSATAPYGWLFTFCPIEHINRVEIMPYNELQMLQIVLAREKIQKTLRVLLENQAAQVWGALYCQTYGSDHFFSCFDK